MAADKCIVADETKVVCSTCGGKISRGGYQ